MKFSEILCLTVLLGVAVNLCVATLVKRSDDPIPLEVLVQQQAATIQRLDTEVTALKTQVAALSQK
ncbi:hypothetical protein BaRGS_00038299, partial [Batillaria attramentaria]